MRTPDPVAITSVLPEVPLGGPTRPGAPVPPPDSPYWLFYREVAAAQLGAWLPVEPCRVLDLSGPSGFAAQLVEAGHEVVLVREDLSDVLVDAAGPGRALPVVADARSLSWLAAASVDLVVAESRALSL